MNVYTGLLFLQGHIADPGVLGDDAGYGAGYGNRVANARAARDSWERRDPIAAAADTVEPVRPVKAA